MTSWKRLFGKKTKKAHRKIEEKYDLWLQQLHSNYGPQEHGQGDQRNSKSVKSKRSPDEMY